MMSIKVADQYCLLYNRVLATKRYSLGSYRVTQRVINKSDQYKHKEV